MGSNVPEVRFKGFDGEWKKERLEKVAKIYDGTHQTPLYQDSGIMFLSVENITTLKSTKYISEEDFAKNFKVYPEKDDILMTRIGDVGTANIVQCEDKIAYYVSLALLKPYNVKPLFLVSAIESSSVQKEIWKRTLHIAFPKKINKNEIENIIIHSPLEETEQALIGNFFKQLDERIAIQRHELEAIKSTKQGFLQKMFPAEGETVPQLRFPGFSGEWETKPLNYFLTVSNERNRDLNYTKDDVLSVSGEYGIVNQIEFHGRSFAGTTIKDYHVVETGDIVYTKSPLKANPYGIIKANFGNPGVVSTLYAVYKCKQNLSAEWLSSYFSSDDNTNKYLRPLVKKGAKNDMKINNNDVLLGMISVPDIEEQIHIGNFFKKLDDIIVLHQQELDALEQTKKAFLQKMFV